MPPIYRIAETALYSLLNFLPFLALAIYPFRNSLRFSKKITALFIAVLTAVQLLLGAWAAFFANGSTGKISVISTLLYAAFYFLAIKKPLGKTLFTLLMLSNFANLAVVSAKCAEGLLFPTLAVQSYRWSFSLMLGIVELILAVPIFWYMKKVFTPAVEREPSGTEWRYLWLIPATFYIVWYAAFYGVLARTALEIALRPKNTLFLLIVNIGAALIYYVVSCLIIEQNKTLDLTRRNHRLTTQNLQYELLQEKINEARRAKHDVRHHIALMQDYLNRGELETLREYLNRYSQSLPDDTLICFCENSAANAVLLYFAQQAKNNQIDYIVQAKIPNNAPVTNPDLSVLFGNLLENALEACKAEQAPNKKIMVRASLTGSTLCITVDNTFFGKLQLAPNGDLISTKHKGMGLGTKSVQSIAEQYGGVCRFEVKNNLFCASVLCCAKQ